MYKTIIYIFAAIALFCINVQAELKFPFRGAITANSVNVRAGADQNFEDLCQLNTGDIVAVVGKDFSWFKIILPQAAVCYIFSEYIQEVENSKAKVKANRVNIRARPNKKSAIIGQLNKDDLVEIKRREEDWVAIVPNSACCGWVNQQFLKYLDDKINITSIEKYTSADDSTQAKENKIISHQVRKNPVEVQGRLKIPWGSISQKYPYKIITPNGEIYYLNFDSLPGREYHNKNAKIRGEMTDKYNNYQVISVNSLVLAE